MSDGKNCFQDKEIKHSILNSSSTVIIFVNQAKTVGLGTTSQVFIPFTQTKIRS